MPSTHSSKIEILLSQLSRHGFSWNDLQDYFPFSDLWSEGEYERLLAASLVSIADEDERSHLLALLDLQYAVMLEQLSIQEKFCKKFSIELQNPIFAERVMGYLQINANERDSGKSVRTALLNIAPGELWSKLFN